MMSAGVFTVKVFAYVDKGHALREPVANPVAEDLLESDTKPIGRLAYQARIK